MKTSTEPDALGFCTGNPFRGITPGTELNANTPAGVQKVLALLLDAAGEPPVAIAAAPEPEPAPIPQPEPPAAVEAPAPADAVEAPALADAVPAEAKQDDKEAEKYLERVDSLCMEHQAVAAASPAAEASIHSLAEPEHVSGHQSVRNLTIVIGVNASCS